MDTNIVKIGSGSYSTVYYYVKDGREIALKQYDSCNRQKLGFSPDCLKDLVIYHNVVDVDINDVEVYNNKFMLSMPYYGNNISKLRKDLSILDIKNVFRSVLMQLVNLHNYNIIHRDIKPHNIVYWQGFNAKLIDYSIACLSEINQKREVYTEWYRPPEICNGCGYGKSADVWSLGLVILECVVDQTVLPYTNTDRTEELAALYYYIKKMDRVGIKNLTSSTNNKYAEILKKAHSRDAELFNLIIQMISREPHLRPTAIECIDHHCFSGNIMLTRDRISDIYYHEFQVEYKLLKQTIEYIDNKFKTIQLLAIDSARIILNSIFIVSKLKRNQSVKRLLPVAVGISAKLIYDDIEAIIYMFEFNYISELELLKTLGYDIYCYIPKTSLCEKLLRDLTDKQKQDSKIKQLIDKIELELLI